MFHPSGCLAASGASGQSILAVLFQVVMRCSGRALSLFTTHSCVSAGRGNCTVAWQLTLPNKRSGNSPLVRRETHREKQRERETRETDTHTLRYRGRKTTQKGKGGAKDALGTLICQVSAKAEGCRSSSSRLSAVILTTAHKYRGQDDFEEAMYYLGIEPQLC